LLETDERVGRRYLHQIEELREQLEREKETACNRERDLAQSKYESIFFLLEILATVVTDTIRYLVDNFG
jgi:vacuolar-type H+-ATPase subunit I/STV1